MNSDKNTNKISRAARLKMVVAGFALAGVLAGGASAIVDVEPVTSEDTTETARIAQVENSWTFSRGVSWQ